MNVDPIVHTYTLGCSTEDAFSVYTRRIGEWWHPGYTANPETLEAVVIEPGDGGRVFATHSDEGELTWGHVTCWQPPHRLQHTFTLAQSADTPSTVTVEFTPAAGGCTVRFEHGGWNSHNASSREKFTDWPALLDRFAVLAEGR